jgi:hypothetical protein
LYETGVNIIQGVYFIAEPRIVVGGIISCSAAMILSTPMCSPAMKETVCTNGCYLTYVLFLFPTKFNVLTAMEGSAVNAVSLALFNIPCKLCSPVPEDGNRTSLWNVVLYSLSLVSGQWNFQAEG